MALRTKSSNLGVTGLDSYSALISRFQLIRQTGSSGLELIWRMFEAIRRSDAKECTVFVFDKRIAEKLHKPKRREAVTEVLRRGVTNLEQYKHTKILQVWHTIPESNDFLAFVSEPVLCSLANFMGNHERLPSPIPEEIKGRKLYQYELKHGVFQINEGLKYLHNVEQAIHGNVCPSSIIITRRGQWKLASLEFLQKASVTKEAGGLGPWNPKQSKMTQPDLDYMAPEVQMNGKITFSCDIFSLALVTCAIFTEGKSLLECNKSPQVHMRKVDELSQNFTKMVGYLPLAFIDVVEKMLGIDTRNRPTSQLFSVLKCFSDPELLILEDFLTVETKAADERREIFHRFIRSEIEFSEPCVRGSLFPLLMEYFNQFPEQCASILPCVLRLIRDNNEHLFKDLMYTQFIQGILRSTKHSQKNAVLMEFIEWYVDKLSTDDMKSEILPICIQCLESNSLASQEAALKAIPYLQTLFDESTIRDLLLPKSKFFFGRSQNIRTKVAILTCMGSFIDKLDKMTIIEQVLPFLTDIHFSDPDIYKTLIKLYKHMLSDKKFGLTHNLLATKVLPHLIPYTVNPSLKGEEFCNTIEVLRAMLEKIERARVCRMKSESEADTPGADTENNLKDVPLISTELPSPCGFYLDGQESQTLNPFDATLADKSKTDRNFKYDYKDSPTTPDYTGRKPWQKAGSSPSMEPRLPKKASSHLQVIGQSQSIDEKGTSLCVPAGSQRRHSYGSGLAGSPNASQPMITASVCEGPFKSPPNSRASSRRPSAQYYSPPVLGMDDKLVVVPAARRSSFNALGDAVLGLFSSSNKT